MNAQDKPVTVVIAEDEALLRTLAACALADEGFTTIEAGHADDVLAICATQAEQIDVLFTDVQMPGTMNGLELARHVRQQWPWIAVLITSGNTVPSSGALPAGIRWFTKPYDLTEIVTHVRVTVTSRQT